MSSSGTTLTVCAGSSDTARCRRDKRLIIPPGHQKAGAGAVADVVQEAMPDSSADQAQQATGGCLCGRVTYTVSGDMDSIVGCHCRQCRKTSGHFVAATRVNENNLTVTDQQALTWYQSSDSAKRGFCRHCGSSLFWKNITRPTISISAGTLDLPTNLKLTHHIYVADASDYVCFNEDDVLYDQSD